VAQPDYVPITSEDRVRPIEQMPVQDHWLADRPGDLHGVDVPKGKLYGSVGPDSGYGLKLARRFEERLQLQPGEHAEDAVSGCFLVGSRRAALFGRAPVIYDMELAYTLWGFLDGAPADLVAFRVPLFQGVGHDYERQREVVDRVREEALRLAPAYLRSRLSDWRELLVVDALR
jgi:hypothetical protein